MTIDFQKAKAYYEGARNNYNSLVTLVGNDCAENVVTQAKAAYEEALKAWTKSQPTRF